MSEILEHSETTKEIINIPINLFKKQAKSFVYKLQTEGRLDVREGKNTPLYYVPGLPRIYRKTLQKYHIFMNRFHIAKIHYLLSNKNSCGSA